jgi:hypothetical protein
MWSFSNVESAVAPLALIPSSAPDRTRLRDDLYLAISHHKTKQQRGRFWIPQVADNNSHQ